MSIKFMGGLKPFTGNKTKLKGIPAILVTFQTAAGSIGNADLGVSGSFVVSASSFLGLPLTYSVVSGALPPGLTLNTRTGAITGTGTTAGVYSFSISAAAGAASAVASFMIAINPVYVQWNTPPNLGSALGAKAVSYPINAAATNGGTITYSLLSGTLPNGLSLSNGSLSGTLSNLTATSTFTIRATYANLVTSDQTFTLAVTAQTVTWNTPASLGTIAAGHVLPNFSATPTSGNVCTFAVTSGTFPSGTSLGTNGIVNGTPANLPGTSIFTIRASDGPLVYADRTFTVTIDQDVLTWVTASNVVSLIYGGTLVSTQLVANSDNGEAVNYALQGGAVPAGLSLSNSGLLSGTTVNNTANFAFTVRASDINGFIDQTFAANIIADAITWTTPANLGTINQSQIYGQNLIAASTAGRSIVYTQNGGTIPSGLMLSTAGLLSGNATANGGNISFTVLATDGVVSNSRTFTAYVNTPPVWGTPSGSLANTSYNTAFTSTIVATDPDGIGSYTIVAGDPIPNTVTQTISNGSYLFAGQVTYLDPNAPVWATTAGSIGTINRLSSISVPLTALPNTANGRTIARYALAPTSNALPTGATLLSNAISQAATFTGTIDLGPLNAADPEVAFQPAPQWNTPAGALPAAIIGTTYRTTMTATPLLGNSLTFAALTTGACLPFGTVMTTNAANNSVTIAGTVDQLAAVGDANTVSLPGPTWNSNSGIIAALNNGGPAAVMTSFALSATPNYGNTIASYAITSNVGIPDGLLMNLGGVISGTVQSTAASRDALFVANGPTWSTSSGSLGSALNGTSQTIPFAYSPLANTTAAVSVISGALPAGLVLTTTNATTGAAQIAGTLDANTTASSTKLGAARTFAFTLRALGSDGGYTDRAFSYTVNVT